jgi:hypothetical protein
VTLDELPAASAADRAARAAAVTIDKPGSRRCRYCGGSWQRNAGSRLDGHAACIVSEAFKAEVAALYRRDPLVTLGTLASACGVPRSVITEWIGRVSRRTGAAPP